MLVTEVRDLFCFVRGRSFIFVRFHEFDGLHAAEAAHVADNGPAALPLAGTALEAIAEFIGTSQ